VQEIQRGVCERERRRDARSRSASDCSVPASTSRAGTCGRQPDDDVAAADQRGRRDCSSTISATPSRIAITATPTPKPAASTALRTGCAVSERTASRPIIGSLSLRSGRRASRSTRRDRPASAVVVRDDHERRAVGVDAIEQRGDLLAGRLIQLARRLVGQQEARAVGERARDRDALHLAARELRRPVIGARAEPDVLEQLARAARRSPSAAPASACGSSTFSAAVSIGSRKKRWKTKPMWRSRSRLRSRSFEARDVAPVEQQRARRGARRRSRACAAASTCRSRTARGWPCARRRRSAASRRDRRHGAGGHLEDAAHVGRLDYRPSTTAPRAGALTRSPRRSVAAIGSRATMRIG
jgi:hypothetical protein